MIIEIPRSHFQRLDRGQSSAEEAHAQSLMQSLSARLLIAGYLRVCNTRIRNHTK